MKLLPSKLGQVQIFLRISLKLLPNMWRETNIALCEVTNMFDRWTKHPEYYNINIFPPFSSNISSCLSDDKEVWIINYFAEYTYVKEIYQKHTHIKKPYSAIGEDNLKYIWKIQWKINIKKLKPFSESQDKIKGLILQSKSTIWKFIF